MTDDGKAHKEALALVGDSARGALVPMPFEAVQDTIEQRDSARAERDYWRTRGIEAMRQAVEWAEAGERAPDALREHLRDAVETIEHLQAALHNAELDANKAARRARQALGDKG